MAENMDKAMDKMNIMKDFEKYVLEHDYSEWTEAEWSEAEEKWCGYPEDSEEFTKLSLLRKQRESKLHDEELYRNYENRQRQERAEMYSMPAPELPEDMMTFAMATDIGRTLDSYAGKVRMKNDFNVVLNNYMNENGIKSNVELCRRTGNKVSTSNLSKIIKSNGTSNRDILWTLAIALRLDEEKTEELFRSTGMTIYGISGLGHNDQGGKKMKREVALRGFIQCEYWKRCSIAELDEWFERNDMKKLCQP